MTTDIESDVKALESFVVDNPELEQLESLLAEFNVFEAIGMVYQEIKHSNFLAFLLDPQQNHGMGDYFLRKFLQRAISTNPDRTTPVSLVDIDIWSLDATLVYREQSYIDLLLINDEHKLAVTIENKIYAGERVGKLENYLQTVRDKHPDYRVLALFLTPEGIAPSVEEYLPISYRLVADLLDETITSRTSQIGAEVQTVVSHYVKMLRRNILTDAMIEELCLKIYRKHKKAIDLIIEHRPDVQMEMAEGLIELINKTHGLSLDKCGPKWASFSASSWDAILPKSEWSWSISGRILCFWFDNWPEKLSLVLEILPGPEEARKKLFGIAQSNSPLLHPTSKQLPANYCRILRIPFLKPQDYIEGDFETLMQKVTEKWNNFVTNDLPRIEKAVIDGWQKSG